MAGKSFTDPLTIIFVTWLWSRGFDFYFYTSLVVNNIEQVLEAAPHKAAAVRSPTTHHENYPS